MEIQLREEYPRPGTDLSLSEEMITTILLTIERIRPEEITYPHQLARIGPYTFAEVRVALAQKAQRYATEPIYRGSQNLWNHKPLPQGRRATLTLWHLIDGTELPTRIKLEVGTSKAYILEYEFPILEPRDGWDAASIRFSDFRSGQLTNLLDMQERETTLEQIQHMWAGLRWLCRNLRTWDEPGFYYPEEVK